MRERPAEPWRPSNVPRLALLMRRWLLETLSDQVKDLDAIIASWRPDVIGADLALFAPFVVLAEKHRLPVAVCSSICSAAARSGRAAQALTGGARALTAAVRLAAG
jgi:hypothetical protein